MRRSRHWLSGLARRSDGIRTVAVVLLLGAMGLAAFSGLAARDASAPEPAAVATAQCTSPPCLVAPRSTLCRPFHMARLDLIDAQGGDMRVQWRVPGVEFRHLDPFSPPKDVTTDRTSSIFFCQAYRGPIEALVQLRDDHPLRYRAIRLTTESSVAVFAASWWLALPVLGVLLPAVLWGPRASAWFAMVFLATYAAYGLLAPVPHSGQLGDNRFYIPAALSLVRHGDLAVDPYAARDDKGFSILRPSPLGYRINYYPAAVSVVVSPLVAWAQLGNPPEERLGDGVAKLVAALGVAVFFVVCRRLGFEVAGGLGLCLVFAFATSQFSIHAGGLYSHNLTTTLGLVAIWLLLGRGLTAWRVFWLAIVSVVGLACRHDFAFCLLGFAVTAWLRSPRLALAYAAWVGMALVPALLGAWHLYGQWLPPYMAQHGVHGFGWGTTRALAGLLVSPNRGLFVFTPVAVLGYWRAVQALVRPADRDPVAVGLAVTVLSLTAALSMFPMWWGGWSYGPRLLCGLLGPLMALVAMQVRAMAASSHRKLALALVAVMFAWGGLVHAKGALVGDDWNAWPANVDTNAERVWDWHDWQVLRALELLPGRLRERAVMAFHW